MARVAIFAAHKRSLGQGNIFAPVCHSVHRGEVGVPGHVHPPQAGTPPGRHTHPWAGTPQEVHPPAGTPPPLPIRWSMRGRYASYWNAFLFYDSFPSGAMVPLHLRRLDPLLQM